jgi:hypothetical protein
MDATLPVPTFNLSRIQSNCTLNLPNAGEVVPIDSSAGDTTCTYYLENINTQESVLQLIKDFFDETVDLQNPDYNELILRANNCEANLSGQGCSNFNVINQQLLPYFCAQYAYLDDCPQYNQNP